jgi:hypothetical protein
MTFVRFRTLARILLVSGLALVVGSTMSLAGFTLPALALSTYSVGDATVSAVTVAWTDQHRSASDTSDPNYETFRHLSFSVNQTANLSHQGITVRWAGGEPTSALQYAQNFMQAMECWGDTPEQCQFGQPSQAMVDKSGFLVQSRSIEPGLDAAQAGDLPPERILAENPDGSNTYAFPFQSVDGTSTFETGELFSSATSNEVSAAPTASDGTGMLNFEVQTSLEAPHLGCGADDGSSTPQPCFLVIVPRGSLDLNGQAPSESAGHINGSPLSASAWKNRVVIPLNFAPVSQSCPIGQAEVRVVGSEVAAKAMTSWQPQLCNTGATYGYSRIGDDEARTQITGTDIGASRMAIVSGALDSASPYAKMVDYAPVTQSAIVVAYNIDYSLYSNSSIYRQKNGTKVHDLKLNQRLVAKLLTQSYRDDTPGAGFGNSTVQANPRSITVDPEFLSLNPDFRDFTRVGPQGLMVSFGNADTNKHVWEWIRANAEASAFLKGAPDSWGMKINPSYKDLGLADGDASVSFPKADLRTYSASSSIPGYGTLDMRPYYNTMDETATRALRADGNVKTAWDPFKLPAPGAYVSIAPQPVGQRFMLALTDLSSAYRYGLDVAALQGTQVGNFVEPTSSSISTAIESQVATATPGVSATNWGKAVPNAYPLSEVTYAAVNVCLSTQDERTAYENLITYATSTGQNLGDDLGNLPYGYVPLSDAQKSLAAQAVADIHAPANKATRCIMPVEPSFASTSPIQAIDISASGGTGHKKMFLRKPMYGEGSTQDVIPVLPKILSAGGYLLGIPMLLTGWLMLRRHRNRSSAQ